MREPAASQIIAGKYRLESLIGHGGMGSVWRGRHLTLDMPVAIKFMGAHAEGDQESRQRFEREARALGTLRTPNIVQVLDHGVDNGTPYIVMEFLEGEDLSARLLRKKRLDIAETSRILSQVARGLRRAHEAGVTHRDMKPSNIFLARIDDEEVAKVLDFGVAKLAATGALGDPQLTRTGTLLGSPGYMSPEQARGKEIDFRSDLWALAVIVFRALTGAKPFAGDSIAELVIKLCIDPRPVPTKFAPDLPPAIDRFFERAFAAAPEDRFQSAPEMAAAFATMLGQPAAEQSRLGSSPVIGVTPAVLDAAAPLAPAPVAPARAAPAPPEDSSLAPSPFTMGPAGTMVVQTKKTVPPVPPRPPAAAPRDVAPPAAPRDVAAIPAARDSAPAALPGNLALEAAPPNAPPAIPTAAPAAIMIPPAPPLSAAVREPTPMPASFGGFAPSGAEASAPPAADPYAPLLPDEQLRAPPIGDLAGDEPRPPLGSDASDSRTPTGMRLHPPGMSGALPPPAMPMLKPLPVLPGPARLELKMVLFAAAGAAALAVIVGLAIAGLRSKGSEATAPGPTSEISDLAPSAAPTASAADLPATASDSASAAPEPSAEPTAEPSVSASAEPSAAPAASAEPTAEPAAAPTVAPKPVQPKPPSTSTFTTPRPHSTTTPTTKSSGKTAPVPTGSAKKKNKKPSFGY